MTEKQSKPKKPSKTVVKGTPLPKKFPADRAYLPIRWVKKALAVALTAVSKDKTRPHLDAVSIFVKGETMIARATEGHWLVNYALQLPSEFHGQPEVEIAIPASTARRLLGELNEMIKDTREDYFYPDGVVLFGKTSQTPPPRDDRTWTCEIVHPPHVIFDVKRGVYEHDFGSIKIPKKGSTEHNDVMGIARSMPRLIGEAKATKPDPAKAKEPARIGLSGNLLANIVKAIKASSDRNFDPSLVISVSTPEAPAVLWPSMPEHGEELTIILMPMRV